jgi:hypothetical protein
MHIPTRLRILGYPALPMVLAAPAIGGMALIGSIVTTDRTATNRDRKAGKP